MKNNKGKGRAKQQPVTWRYLHNTSNSDSDTDMAKARRASLRVSTAGGSSSYERHLDSNYTASPLSTSSSNWSDYETNIVKGLSSLPSNVSDKILGVHSSQVQMLDTGEAILQMLTSGHTILSYEGRFNMLHYAFALLTHELYGAERAEWNRRERAFEKMRNDRGNSADENANGYPEYPELKPYTRELVQFITCLLNLLYAFARDRLSDSRHLTHMERRMRRMGDELQMAKISPLLVDIAHVPDSVTFMQAALVECLQPRSQTFPSELKNRLERLVRVSNGRPLQWALPVVEPVPFHTDNEHSNSDPNLFLEPHYPHRALQY